MTIKDIEKAILKDRNKIELSEICLRKGKPVLVVGTIEINGVRKQACWTCKGACFVGNERFTEHDLIVTP